MAKIEIEFVVMIFHTQVFCVYCVWVILCLLMRCSYTLQSNYCRYSLTLGVPIATLADVVVVLVCVFKLHTVKVVLSLLLPLRTRHEVFTGHRY